LHSVHRLREIRRAAQLVDRSEAAGPEPELGVKDVARRRDPESMMVGQRVGDPGRRLLDAWRLASSHRRNLVEGDGEIAFGRVHLASQLMSNWGAGRDRVAKLIGNGKEL